MPSEISGCPILALSPHTRRSAHSANSQPPPLGFEVLLHVAMEIEMVTREIRENPRGEAHVGTQGELAAATERVAGDGGHDGLRDGGDRSERRLQGARARDHVGVGHRHHLLDVRTRSEDLLAAIEDHRGDVGARPHLGRGHPQLLLKRHVERVHRRAVQPDGCDAALNLKADELAVCHRCLPDRGLPVAASLTTRPRPADP